ncbi:hypothetical protein EUX98_g6085 [Antrodiella citrinella]|uniref:Protein kinase domain-containing protein n=1 Tax=Antrodiella citrinella TaxID=2447956 RepID=A0A4S4MRR7_9APHY|nr:hypothetical protein EUX98_g6085 [Antrodiella citrinella]
MARTIPAVKTPLNATPLNVGIDGQPLYGLTYASEPLGFGWAQLDFGQKIGPHGRYTIERKLGWGTNSSTWLARDTMAQRFVAVKVTTSFATDMDRKNLVWEADALNAVSHLPLSPHCIRVLESHFTLPGKGLSGDNHLCFVTPVYGGDVESLWSAIEALPTPVAKRILLHLLRGIAHVHSRGFVHADIKMSNIFFDTVLSTHDIEKFLATDPPRRHDPENSPWGIMQSAVSQPLPMISSDQAQRANFLLGDLGCAQPSRLRDGSTANYVLYRAPEVWMNGEWDKPADIWAFGCLVRYTTGDWFMGKQLSSLPGAVRYFKNENGYSNFISDKEVVFEDDPFDYCIARVTNRFTDSQELEIGALMKRCLRLVPEDRATAEDLLTDAWFSDVAA